MTSHPAATEWSAVIALQRATHTTLHLLADRLVDLNLTAAEINALANLADGRGRTVSELGAAMCARPSTVTGVLDRLEVGGHVTRTSLAGDRRAVLVRPTPRGRKAAATIRRAIADLETHALGPLSDAAVAGLREGLAALAKVPR